MAMGEKKVTMTILAGDIGGTNTRLALFEENKTLLRQKTFPSKKYGSLNEIVKQFLEEKVKIACFGIAGPVKNNQCHATNLPWIIDGHHLEEERGIGSVFLINDLEANAFGIRALKKEEFFVLNEGDVQQKGNEALISAGTGLGEAGLFWDGKEYEPFACEGGHGDFAPRDEEEIELLLFLKQEFGHVSYERVLSGPGMYNIYRFYVEKKGKKGFESSVDPKQIPREITKSATGGGCEAATLALDRFIRIYGAEAGNTALRFLSLSGLYLGGGIAPRVVNKMKEGGFMEAFFSKGRFEEFLRKIPVKVVMNDQAALLGSLECALLRGK